MKTFITLTAKKAFLFFLMIAADMNLQAENSRSTIDPDDASKGFLQPWMWVALIFIGLFSIAALVSKTSANYPIIMKNTKRKNSLIK